MKDDSGWRSSWFGQLLKPTAAVVVMLLCSAHLLLSFEGGFRTVNHVQAAEDLSRGHVTSRALTDDRPGQAGSLSGLWWTAPDLVEASVEELQTGTTSVVYTVAGEEPRLVVPDLVVTGSGDGVSWSEAETEWIREELMTSALPSTVEVQAQSGVAQTYGLLGMLLAGSMLVHVLFGPVPMHGNRWFWFWLIGLPAGVGVLAYAVWEVSGWQDRRAPAPEDRSGGGTGVLVLLGGSFLVLAAGRMLADLLGVTVIPL